MNGRLLVVVALSGLALLAACGAPTATGAPGAPSGAGAGGSFSAMLNGARSARSLNPLTTDARLAQAARDHAEDMSINGYFSHTSLDGRTFGDRIRATGYSYCWAAENIAVGQTGKAQVFDTWMNSPPHRANMLSARARQIGLGRSAARNYWVLLLAEPGC